MSEMTPPALGDDWPAIAVHAAHHDITSPAEALTSWRALNEDRRIAWRASADAVRMLLDAKPAPELAAAMAETRGIREKLTAEAHRLDTAAAKAEKARGGSRDGTYRMMLDQRAEWCREQAAVLRGIAGIGDGQ